MLGAGSLLIAAAALSRDDSPRWQLLADRRQNPAGAKQAAPAGMTGAILTTDAAAPRSSGAEAPCSKLAKSPHAIEAKRPRSIARSSPAISEPVPVVPSHVFHNASLQIGAVRTARRDRPPFETAEVPTAKAAVSSRPSIALKAEIRPPRPIHIL